MSPHFRIIFLFNHYHLSENKKHTNYSKIVKIKLIWERKLSLSKPLKNNKIYFKYIIKLIIWINGRYINLHWIRVQMDILYKLIDVIYKMMIELHFNYSIQNDSNNFILQMNTFYSTFTHTPDQITLCAQYYDFRP